MFENLQKAVENLKQNLNIYVEDAELNGSTSPMTNEWLAQLDEIFKAAYGQDDETVSLIMS